MSSALGRKNRIELSDYNYRADIEHRLMMSDFTEMELKVLQEVLDSSLRFSVDSLAYALDSDESEITPILEQLQRTKLFQVSHGQVIVDKECRKYYETQIDKFDDDFEPDIEFALNLLRRVPIHVLPNWYAIPKSTDDIFSSILEKHLATPETYRRYVQDLGYEEPLGAGIVRMVFNSPDFKVGGKEICEKFKLSREAFEEALLRLEFQLVCFLSYSRIDGEWREVVTPLHEWRQFMRCQLEKQPVAIPESEVKRYRSDDLGFALDLAAVLRASKEDGIHLPQNTLELTALQSWLSSVANEDAVQDPEYRSAIVARAIQLHLAEVVDQRLQVLAPTAQWLRQSPEEQALILYRCVDKRTERDLRAVERGLKRVVNAGWITFNDFMKGFTLPVGGTGSVSLVKKGRRWRYEFPNYSDDELAFIQNMIFQHLFQAGVIARGVWEGQDCFKVTPLGKFTLSE